MVILEIIMERNVLILGTVLVPGRGRRVAKVVMVDELVVVSRRLCKLVRVSWWKAWAGRMTMLQEKISEFWEVEMWEPGAVRLGIVWRLLGGSVAGETSQVGVIPICQRNSIRRIIDPLRHFF